MHLPRNIHESWARSMGAQGSNNQVNCLIYSLGKINHILEEDHDHPHNMKKLIGNVLFMAQLVLNCQLGNEWHIANREGETT